MQKLREKKSTPCEKISSQIVFFPRSDFSKLPSSKQLACGILKMDVSCAPTAVRVWHTSSQASEQEDRDTVILGKWLTHRCLEEEKCLCPWQAHQNQPSYIQAQNQNHSLIYYHITSILFKTTPHSSLNGK